MRRNSGDRWLIWSDLGEPRRSCRASSNRLPRAIWNWVRQADRDDGRRPDGPTSAEREELTRLRRENRQRRQERDILAKAAAWFARETAVIPGLPIHEREPGLIRHRHHGTRARRVERSVRPARRDHEPDVLSPHFLGRRDLYSARHVLKTSYLASLAHPIAEFFLQHLR